MNSKIRVLIICVISLLSVTKAKDLNLDLEYSLDGSNFSKLGSLSLQQRHDGNYTGNVKFDSSISQSLYDKIRSKAELSPNSLYYVKSGDLLSSNAACYMLQVNLAHRIAVTIDQENGVVESLTVFPDGLYDIEPIGEKCVVYSRESSPRLTSTVEITSVKELPVPETTAYLQRMEDEKRNRQHGAATDNRSFLAKYWMYIVPVVVFMVISSFMSGDDGGGQ
uniref:ER membrane protein complex subunit 10 n=1 Tax=Panagrolaimus superbus TaxID=310955 RepID=A0A914Y950_9BILA